MQNNISLKPNNKFASKLMTQGVVVVNFSEIPLKFNAKREIGAVVHPGDVAETAIAIQTVNVLHVTFSNLEIKNVKVLLDASLGDRFWDDYDTAFDLQIIQSNSNLQSTRTS